MKASLALSVALLGILLTACGGSSAQARPATGPTDLHPPSDAGDAGAGEQQQGRASYYSDRLTGRATASGEPYDPKLLTAAHRKLPFGTIVDVIRPDGRRVQVRINDRGPFTKGRIIDLSRKAAETIGLVREGVAEVTVVVVSKPPPRRR
ncbi:septal ring lytic transglycosylase RlpA family protein [Chondromyces apiculatus]|uniref:Probable endolytic peptidoglycan transglycosylase RlpA n=1 Tax=Chondromyces apiculatus DSM 436 TaxID=1192034 RepID=A0A017TES1_9BACT|nr:septal ring lytic transglycosylase RlpA family protein [Chondromyces apiculatus]EYF07798.1 Rare lipoprotein A [Chondromyces apiculatus DSM 436]